MDGDNEPPQLWIVAVPNGAGKTTLVTERLRGRLDIINPDEIAQDLPRINGRLDERSAGEIAIKSRNDLLAKRKSIAIETTLTGKSPLQFMRRAQELGYKLTLVYVGLDSPELSESRVSDRVKDGGHDVPSEAIIRRYPNSLANLSVAMELADRSYVLDNSGKRRRLLLIRDCDRARLIASDLPPWFTERVPLAMRHFQQIGSQQTQHWHDNDSGIKF